MNQLNLFKVIARVFQFTATIRLETNFDDVSYVLLEWFSLLKSYNNISLSYDKEEFDTVNTYRFWLDDAIWP